MKGYKTALISLAVIILGAIEAFDWAQIVPPNLQEWIVPAIGAVFLYLRTITNTALGKSE